MKVRRLVVLAMLGCVSLISNAAPSPSSGVAVGTPPAQVAPGYARWSKGLPADPHFFPIAVWLQNPRNASRYKAAGINLYVALWLGPTASQLADLKQAGMPVICSQNQLGLQHANDPIIVGWMHGDEPDNAQGIPGLRRYGPPVAPEKIVRDYQQIRAADPTRPVMLNLGQGVAYDNYIGRGVRRNHPEDYAEYLKGCDIASFDIYPVVHGSPEVTGQLEYVARGVERLRQWAGEEKIVWNCIECTHIENPSAKATPEQVRAEVWMSLIHGSRGLIYFVHQFKPDFKEAALLEDPVLLPAVTRINQQIHDLAPVLNSLSVTGAVKVSVNGNPVPEDSRTWAMPQADAKLSPPPLAWMVKRSGAILYVFTVNMHSEALRTRFAIEGTTNTEAEVLGEGRRVFVQNGSFSDEFKPYEVHLYRTSGH